MKEIDLKNGFSAGVRIDLTNVDNNQVNELGQVLLGTINVKSMAADVEIARRNGAQIVWAALEIEKSIDSIISCHMFMPIGLNRARDFFNNEFLSSSILQFSHKKELVKKVVQQRGLLHGKKKNRLGAVLKVVVERRNAFAHGQITAMQDRGCVLQYFSSHHQEDLLTDDYWNEVESTVIEAKDLLTMASEKMTEQLSEHIRSEGDSTNMVVDEESTMN